MGFGWKMVDLYRSLTSTNRGLATLPEPLPDAMTSFREMPDESDSLMFADIQSIYNYLRRNRHMKIPQHWKELVPKPTWFHQKNLVLTIANLQFSSVFWGTLWFFSRKYHFWELKIMEILNTHIYPVLTRIYPVLNPYFHIPPKNLLFHNPYLSRIKPVFIPY